MDSELSNDALLHAPAMTRVTTGVYDHCASLLRKLAEQANESNAAIASVTLRFIVDDEPVDAKYVPEITITVRSLAE